MQVYSGAASEAAFIGKESPGPMAYDQHRSGIGRQVGVSAEVVAVHNQFNLSVSVPFRLEQQMAYSSSPKTLGHMSLWTV